VKNKFNW